LLLLWCLLFLIALLEMTLLLFKILIGFSLVLGYWSIFLLVLEIRRWLYGWIIRYQFISSFIDVLKTATFGFLFLLLKQLLGLWYFSFILFNEFISCLFLFSLRLLSLFESLIITKRLLNVFLCLNWQVLELLLIWNIQYL